MQSPRLDDELTAAQSNSDQIPAPSSRTEVEWLVTLASSRGASTITLGHARDQNSAAAVHAFAALWTASGRTVLRIVDWPENAASWLRQAHRFAEPEPDLWVVAGRPLGWAQMARRLTWSTSWRSRDTLAFSSLAAPSTQELAGPTILEELSGALPNGRIWRMRDSQIVIEPGIAGDHA